MMLNTFKTFLKRLQTTPPHQLISTNALEIGQNVRVGVKYYSTKENMLTSTFWT